MPSGCSLVYSSPLISHSLVDCVYTWDFHYIDLQCLIYSWSRDKWINMLCLAKNLFVNCVMLQILKHIFSVCVTPYIVSIRSFHNDINVKCVTGFYLISYTIDGKIVWKQYVRCSELVWPDISCCYGTVSPLPIGFKRFWGSHYPSYNDAGGSATGCSVGFGSQFAQFPCHILGGLCSSVAFWNWYLWFDVVAPTKNGLSTVASHLIIPHDTVC